MHPLLKSLAEQHFGPSATPGCDPLLRALDAELSQRDADAEAVRATDHQFQTLAETIAAATFIYQGNRFRYVNTAATELTGYTRAELLTMEFWSVVHPEHREMVRERGLARQRGETLPDRYPFKLVRKDGTERWVDFTAGRIEFQGEPAGLGTAFDITERTYAEEALARQALAFANLYDAMVITDPEGRITDWNPAAERIYGWTRAEVPGETVDLWLALSEASDLNRRILDALDTVGRWTGKIRLQRKDGRLCLSEPVVLPLRDQSGPRLGALRGGEPLHCLVSATLRRAPDGTVRGYHGIIHDISERKRAEERLAYGALHDALTGLPNRALFMDRLERAVEQGRRGGGPLAVLFVDLDRFKVVNDSLGHGVGDRLLVEIARRLSAALPPDATVARFGGDEFTLLLPPVATAVDATHMAERLLDALAMPFALAPGQDVFATASMGIALASGSGDAPEELLRNADAALSRAKARGKNRYEVFDRAMHAEAVERLRLETDLRRALERNELRLLFQPIVALNDGRVAGFEGLLRWDHPERGTIPPDVFIPLAEETGLISAVGRWVLEAGCGQLAEWGRRYPDRPLIVSLNLSARQFSDGDLAGHVAQTVARCAVDPSRLWLEITETVILENAEPVRSTLGRLKEQGVALCMDDFGTGYSSLSYLHRIDLDELKIDRTFVSRMDHDRRSAQLVHAIIALAHNLGVRVVAEGVETASQLASLRGQRCDYAQGFLFARPLTTSDADLLLDRDTRW